MGYEPLKIKFYDVRNRDVLMIDVRKVTKFTFSNHHGLTRYGLQTQLPDGRTLTKFVDKELWDKLPAQEAQ
jgi:hypothetical protein